MTNTNLVQETKHNLGGQNQTNSEIGAIDEKVTVRKKCGVDCKLLNVNQQHVFVGKIVKIPGRYACGKRSMLSAVL